MAVTYLAGGRMRGTNAEREAFSVANSLSNSGISKTSCVAYYNFEQTSGNLINQATSGNGFTDGLGSALDGTVTGTVTKSHTGKVGSNAWYFDGSNDYVSLGSTSMTGNYWTFACWIKGASSSQGGSLWNFAGKGAADTDEVFNIWYQSNSITIEYTGANILYITPSTLDDGNWHFLVIRQNNGSLTCYIDNSLIGTKSTSSPSSGARSRTLLIGKRDRGTGYFKGYMDELSIWDRVLTTNEISTLSTITNPNLQDGTIFEEEDTNKHFIYTASSGTWTEV